MRFAERCNAMFINYNFPLCRENTQRKYPENTQIFAAKRSSTTEIPAHKIKTTHSRLFHVAKTATLDAGNRCIARVMDCMFFIFKIRMTAVAAQQGELDREVDRKTGNAFPQVAHSHGRLWQLLT
jgi:hypothetical protein